MKILKIPGNLGALVKWAGQFSKVEFINESKICSLAKNEILCLPGGNIGSLPTKSLQIEISNFLKDGGRLFAVCGAFQALFSSNEEDDTGHYLSLFPSRGYRLKCPNIGFNKIEASWCAINAYFNCKYGVHYNKDDWVQSDVDHVNLATDKLGNLQAIQTNSILGVQFHPELSFGNFDAVFENWVLER